MSNKTFTFDWVKEDEKGNLLSDTQKVSVIMPIQAAQGKITNGEYTTSFYFIGDAEQYTDAEKKEAEKIAQELLIQKRAVLIQEDNSISPYLDKALLYAYHIVLSGLHSPKLLVQYHNFVVPAYGLESTLREIKAFTNKHPKIGFLFERYNLLNHLVNEYSDENPAFSKAYSFAENKDFKSVTTVTEAPKTKYNEKYETAKKAYINTDKTVYVHKDGNVYPPIWLEVDYEDTKVNKALFDWHVSLIIDTIDKDELKKLKKMNTFELVEEFAYYHFHLLEIGNSLKTLDIHKEHIAQWDKETEFWKIHKQLVKFAQKSKDRQFLLSYQLPALFKKLTNCTEAYKKNVYNQLKELDEQKASLHNLLYNLLKSVDKETQAPILETVTELANSNHTVEEITDIIIDNMGDQDPFQMPF